MPPTPRERLDARIRNKEALALRRKASGEIAETGPPADPVLRAAYDKGHADAFAEAAAVGRRETNVAEAAKACARQNKARRDIAAAVRASVARPLPASSRRSSSLRRSRPKSSSPSLDAEGCANLHYARKVGEYGLKV
jgi:hypothetical protein